MHKAFREQKDLFSVILEEAIDLACTEVLCSLGGARLWPKGDVAPQGLSATAGRVALEPWGGTKKQREGLGCVRLSAARSSGCWHPVAGAMLLGACAGHCVAAVCIA